VAELEGTHHFDGDGCAELDQLELVRLHPSSREAPWERERWADEIKEGDLFQFLTDPPLTWWYAQEVVILDSGDTVHIEYSETHPLG
jgi:hypothetical protein